MTDQRNQISGCIYFTLDLITASNGGHLYTSITNLFSNGNFKITKNLWDLQPNRINGPVYSLVSDGAVFSVLQKMVIGTAGQMVAKIAREAGEDLSRVYLREVKLRLSVKLKK